MTREKIKVISLKNGVKNWAFVRKTCDLGSCTEITWFEFRIDTRCYIVLENDLAQPILPRFT